MLRKFLYSIGYIINLVNALTHLDNNPTKRNAQNRRCVWCRKSNTLVCTLMIRDT